MTAKFLLLLPALLALADEAGAQFCPPLTIEPPCCPSPCPIIDLSRLGTLVSQVQSVGQSLAAERQLAAQASAAWQAVGGVAGASSQMTGEGNWSYQRSAFAGGMPKDPLAIAQSVKASLFETAGLAAADLVSRRRARIAALQDEAAGALAFGLTRTRTLPGDKTPGPVAPAQDLRGDLAANSAARLAFLSDSIRLRQEAAAWIAPSALQNALQHGSALAAQP